MICGIVLNEKAKNKDEIFQVCTKEYDHKERFNQDRECELEPLEKFNKDNEFIESIMKLTGVSVEPRNKKSEAFYKLKENDYTAFIYAFLQTPLINWSEKKRIEYLKNLCSNRRYYGLDSLIDNFHNAQQRIKIFLMEELEK